MAEHWPGAVETMMSAGQMMVGGVVSLVVSAVALLLAVLGSIVAAETVALLVIVPVVASATLTTIVMAAEAPALIVPRAKLRVVVPENVPCDVVAEAKVVPAGMGSVTTTDVAASGPLFTTVNWYVSVVPANTGAGLTVLERDRSAVSTTAPGLTETLALGPPSRLA